MIINENWKVESDNMGITIFQKGVKGEKAVDAGAETWKTYGYYSTPQATLRGMLSAEVMGTGLKDFETIVAKIEEVKKVIENTDFKIEKAKDGVVEITQKEYESLQNDSKKLNALECAGVDNWSGYGYAMSEYFKNDEEESEEE